jgi:hypothetical protein
MKKALIIGGILVALALALGYWNKKREPVWNAYPDKIIVDTPEEFQRKNTP